MKKQFIICLLFLPVLISACTFANKQAFGIDYSNSKSSEVVMNEIESYFIELGFRLELKRHITYPKEERYSEFYLGTHRLPILYTAFDYVVLRLEEKDHLYIDWVRISDRKEKPPPGYFDNFYQKVATTIEDRTGVRVSFRLIEEKKEP